MAVPTPTESKALIPAANTPICPKVIQGFIENPVMTDRIVSSIWNDDGTVTDAFKASIGLTVGALAAPTTVSATDGTYPTKVKITWSPVSGAISYQVFRSPTNDTSTAGDPIGSPSATSYEDGTVTVGTSYFYWVKAVNAGGVSAFSTGDSGYAGSSSSQTVLFPASTTFTVPAGITSLNLFAVGGGGGGGGGKGSFPSGLAGGGGGGAGEYRTVTGVSVTPLEVLTVNVSTGGAGGAVISNGAQGNGVSSVLRANGTVLLLAIPGNGGAGAVLSGGAGGSGGSGGSGGTTTSGGSGTAGATTGGAGAAANNGYGAGGAGGDTQTAGTAGSQGQVWITY